MSKRWQREVVDLDHALREQWARQDDYPVDAWDLLSQNFSPARRARLAAAAAGRTRHIRLVVQDIFQPHNVSACIRSADAFGIQNIDVVTLKQAFKASTVAKGVSHWLSIKRYHTITDCVQVLRQSGYKIAAGLPRQDAVSLYDLPLDQPLAVVFGNEHAGIHDEWLAHVDHAFTIPMVGLVESLNISVSCAITLAHLSRSARQQLGARYHLTADAQNQLLSSWACRQTPGWQAELARLRTTSGREPQPAAERRD